MADCARLPIIRRPGLRFKQVTSLRTRRRRLAGAERGSRVLQCVLNCRCVRVRATEHAPRDTIRVLEHRHGLAESVERGASILLIIDHPW